MNQYITEMYDGRREWFVEEVSQVSNMQRVNDIIEAKEYLSGSHDILKKPSYQFNGVTVEPRKIVLQYAKTIINFSVGYLLSNPITLTGNKNVVDAFKKVYKRGKYNRVDYDLLDKMSKYGFVAEYPYLDGERNIQSKVFDPADSYPVYDHKNEYIAFIEQYCIDGIDYYTVYYPDVVESWSNIGGELRLLDTKSNLCGLPIIYRNQSEISNLGRSDLTDIASILDSMEDLLSKATDGYYRYISGIPVIIGQQLKGDGIPKDIVGAGIVLEDGADFKFVSNEFDHQAFESLYKTLTSALLDISNIPAVSMSKTDISNLSEVSIRLLFSLSDMKGALNAKFMREGIEQRFEIIRKLLEYNNVKFTDDEYDTLDFVFQFARPQNDKEIVENLKALNEMKAISLESILERNPYVTDVQGEMQRIKDGNVLNENASQ
ncbi:phage portal protein [Paenibacillus thermotolerans]|uniref:phage portal protein n=1 Tax=Paenibacillus thermotolerans TaxID=3027807 RepID=UPI00236807B3|nr:MULTISPECIES: phage portal protein [unclassified Paenibacillus]